MDRSKVGAYALLIVLIVAWSKLIDAFHPPSPWGPVAGFVGVAVAGILLGWLERGTPIKAAFLLAIPVTAILLLLTVLAGAAPPGGVGAMVIAFVFATLLGAGTLAIAAMVTQAVLRRSVADVG